MSTVGPIVPPMDTNNPDPSTDPSPSTTYSPQGELDDTLAWMQTHSQDVGQLLSDIQDHSKSLAKSAGFAANTLGWILSQIYKLYAVSGETLTQIEADAFKAVLAASEDIQATEFADVVPMLQSIMGGSAGPNVNFGGSSLGDVAGILYDLVIKPFSLIESTADPSQVGSGIQNQSFLLSQALGLAVTQWFVDSASSRMGGGVLKSLQPILWLMSSAVNPYNAVRMAMDASYKFLLSAPLTRDLNRAYPIKDLGLSALAKLYIRGEITGDEFLSRCLDSGVNNQWAEQLVFETQKYISPGDIALLLNHQLLTTDEARTRLLQQGYLPGEADLRLYIDQHSRYWSIAERVGNEAVAAWKKGYIDQGKLESILQSTGYTDPEIKLLELEGQFTKQTTDHKSLDYTQIKDMFKRNIVGIDDVINFLAAEGYTADDVNKLVLLDFTEAAEMQVREATLIARLRVAQEQADIQAAAAAAKSEADLAAAKKALASALGQAAGELGALQTLAGIQALL